MYQALACSLLPCLTSILLDRMESFLGNGLAYPLGKTGGTFGRVSKKRLADKVSFLLNDRFADDK